MKNFLVLYMATQETFDSWSKATKEEQDAGMAAWSEWMKANEESLVSPGNPAGKNMRVTAAGMDMESNGVCGYSVVKADSLEAVAEIMKGNPQLQEPGAYVDVMELFNMD